MSPFQGSSPAIHVQKLSKTYVVHEQEQGVVNAMKSLFNRKYLNIEAVKDVSFDIQRGEMIGFLGPNGAGKTTTIKMLAGLLLPTAGEVTVLGYTPFERDNKLLAQISLAMGRRDQLYWDIPPIETFEFFRAIYGIPRDQYTKTLGEFTELMNLGPLLKKPVRNLSLGERMKCELVGALLHRPQIVFFDEPTIGLDILAQHNFRDYIADYNRKYNATIVLTSHYMGDVEQLCERVIFIDRGSILYDGKLRSLIDRLLPYKLVEFSLENGSSDLRFPGEIVSRENGHVTLKVGRDDTVRVTADLVSHHAIRDLVIKDPPVEEVVKHVFTHGFGEAKENKELRKWRRAVNSETA